MSGRGEVKVVPKPWGHEIIWAHTDRYVGKVLHINAGHALSVQYHERKDETVYLLAGELIYWVKLDGEMRDMKLKVGSTLSLTTSTSMPTRSMSSIRSYAGMRLRPFRIMP